MEMSTVAFYIITLAVVILLFKNGDISGCLKIFFSYFKSIKKILITILVIAVLIILVDRPISMWMLSIHRPWLTLSIQYGNFIGEGIFIYALLIAFYIVLLLFQKTTKLFYTIHAAIISSALAGLSVIILKGIFSRERPFVGLNPYHLFSYHLAMAHHAFGKFPYVSFPSGHTIVITAAVLPFVIVYTKRWWSKLLLIIPLYVALARVYGLFHWTSDVTTSFLLGTLFAYAAVEWCHKYWNLTSRKEGV